MIVKKKNDIKIPVSFSITFFLLLY